jgi:predicted glutamine amidotransferase
MCGIAGVRRYGPEPITPEEIKLLLLELEHRGNHATGAALMSGGQIRMMKAPEPAFSFVARPEFDKFLDEFLPDATTAILHTRYATQGNPSVNENNHPMYMGHTAVVHNGSISNDKWVFDQLKMPRSCETDSDVFRAEFDKYGLTREAIKHLNALSGSAAIAAISNEDPEHLVLARSGSPICYATTPHKLMWASTMPAIHKALRPFTFHHGLPARAHASDAGFYVMPDDTAYILGPKGFESKDKFALCTYYRKPNYDMRGTYASKMAGFKSQERNKPPSKPMKKTHACPNTKCTAHPCIGINEKWAGYRCGTCDTDLTPLDRIPMQDMTLIS